jgi:protein ImuB
MLRLVHGAPRRETPAALPDNAALPWRKRPSKRPPPSPTLPAPTDDGELAGLVDRLGGRLGLGSVYRLAPLESHVPERAQARAPVLEPLRPGWPAAPARPVRLLAAPEPVEAMAPVPDDPPLWFRWRRVLHRVARADGPERIAAEWWRAPTAPDDEDIRDYYRVEDAEGRRFWLFRAGFHDGARGARWFLHGIFP